MCVSGMYRKGLGPTVVFQGRVTANQYKVILSDSCHPVMKPFSPPPGRQIPPIHRTQGDTSFTDYESV